VLPWSISMAPADSVTALLKVTVKLVTMDRCAEPSLTCTACTVTGVAGFTVVHRGGGGETIVKAVPLQGQPDRP
jgi:hypothetical protein